MTIFKNQKIHHLDNKYLPHALMTDFNIEIICKDRYPKGSISRSYRVILQALDIDKEANGIYLMDAGQKPSSTNDRGQSIGAPRPPVEPFPGAQTGQATPPPYQSLAPNHIPPIYQGYSPEHQRPPAFNPECLDDSDEYDHLDMPPPFNPNGGH